MQRVQASVGVVWEGGRDVYAVIAFTIYVV